MPTPGKTFGRAQDLRRRMSPPEVRLWVRLRRSPGGVKFRRQHPLGPYILDFYCPQARICVEIDGAFTHDGQNADHDARRTAWLEGRGIRVIRVSAAEAMRNADEVAGWLIEEARAALLPVEDGEVARRAGGAAR